jgi:hypothetical protein
LQAFTDSLLDLILSVDDIVKNLVDYYGKDELFIPGRTSRCVAWVVFVDGAAIVFPIVHLLALVRR